MLISYLSTLLLAAHPSCLPLLRQTEETLFQAQTAIKTSQEQHRKLELRAKTLETLAAEGAISRKQRDNVRDRVTISKKEIDAIQVIITQAKAQITILQTRPQCGSPAKISPT